MSNLDTNGRRWWHWHRSTLLVGLLTTLPLGLIVVPGELSTLNLNTGFEVREHGWPLVHRYRLAQTDSTTVTKSDFSALRALGFRRPSSQFWPHRYWSQASNWKVFAGPGIWLPGALIINLACSLLIVLAVCVYQEIRVRRPSGVWTFRVIEGLIAVSIVSLVANQYRLSTAQLRREQAVASRWREHHSMIEVVGARDMTPNWLRRILDNRHWVHRAADAAPDLPVGWRIETIEIHDYVLPIGQTTDEYADQIDQLCCLENLIANDVGDHTLEILQLIEPSRIRKLDISLSREVRQLQNLGRFTNLRELVITNVNFAKVQFDYPDLNQLETIYLNLDYMDDRTLQWLTQQPKLKRLGLYGDGMISKPELARLRKTLPGVEIVNRYDFSISSSAELSQPD